MKQVKGKMKALLCQIINKRGSNFIVFAFGVIFYINESDSELSREMRREVIKKLVKIANLVLSKDHKTLSKKI